MADPPPYDSNRDTGVGPDRGSTAGTPRWVKVFGIIALVLILVFVILLLTGGGGGHGPGRHTAAGDGVVKHRRPAGESPVGFVATNRPPVATHLR
jgi:hypothetical protein